MADMSNMTPASGRIIAEDGSVKNVVDILGAGAVAPVSTEVHDIEQYSPRSGRVIGEDGLLYNLVDLLEAGGGGGSDAVWRPTVESDGTISWQRSTSTTPPTTQNIKGTPGTDGQDGADGSDGAPGADGQDGAPGVGVPAGGSTGQVLTKASGADFDTEWKTGGGSGGGTVISSNDSVENIVEMDYAEFSQLSELEPNTIYNISDHPADMTGGGGIIGNVPKYVDKTLAVGQDSATLRIFHTGSSALLEVIDDEFILGFVILALLPETQFKSPLGWGVEQLQAVCEAFHYAEIDRMNVSGLLGGQALNANLENIVVTHDEADPSRSEIVGMYSLPDMERNLPSQSYLLKVYYDDWDEAVYADARFLAMGGGSFQTRWTRQGINATIDAGDALNISQFLHDADVVHRGLAGMEIFVEPDGKIIFPPIASFAPYQIDIRINGNIGTGAPNTAMTFSVDLGRFLDESIARSYGVPAVEGETLNDISLGGLTYTDGADDPFSAYGAFLQINNQNTDNNTITVQDVDVTIQGTRS
jgi:hypothetical protein